MSEWIPDEVPVDPQALDEVAPEELGDLRSSDIPEVENVDDVPAPPGMDSGGAGESTESQILGNADEMQ